MADFDDSDFSDFDFRILRGDENIDKEFINNADMFENCEVVVPDDITEEFLDDLESLPDSDTILKSVPDVVFVDETSIQQVQTEPSPSKKVMTCNKCGKLYTSEHWYNRHINIDTCSKNLLYIFTFLHALQ